MKRMCEQQINEFTMGAYKRCCDQFRNKCLFDFAIKGKICLQCNVAVEQHREVCSKVWRQCRKCVKSKEHELHFCLTCGSRNTKHRTSTDCVCKSTLNKMDSASLKRLYQRLLEPSKHIDQMSTHQYTMFKLKEALSSNTIIAEDSKTKPYKKQTIPQALRRAVWDEYMGTDKRSGPCYCCNRKVIDLFDFVCGHVVAESKGGSTTLKNLRPICSLCNLSMKTTNLEEFRLSFQPPSF